MNNTTKLFDVDSAKCVRCGACVRDCAFRAIRQDASGFPVMPDEAKCAKCQHCFAICPTGAITFDGRDAASSVSRKGLDLPSWNQVSNWMNVRRSTRRFKNDDVPRETIDAILRQLSASPTGCNARSLTFTCYPDRAAMNAFRASFIKAIEQHRDGAKLLPRWLAVPAIRMRKGAEDLFFRGATGMVIISSDETNPAVTTPFEDVIAACTYFEMLAQAKGLATCWCGFLKLVQREVPELLEKTSAIRRTTPFYAMLFGNSAISYPRGTQREGYASIVYKDASQI